MRRDYLDRYSRAESPIHHLPASLKMGTVFFVLCSLLVMPGKLFIALGTIAIVLAVISVIARLPIEYIVKRMLFLGPFAIIASVVMLIRPDGFQMFVWYASRALVSLFALLLLTATTPFASVLQQLKRWRVPALLVTVMALMYRYVFLIVDEAERMTRARQGRTFSRSRRGTWKLLSMIIGQLFIRSTERSERIFAAMQARGWQ